MAFSILAIVSLCAVLSVLAAAAGLLWLLLRGGKRMDYLEGDEARSLQRVWSLLEDERGIWVGTNGGLNLLVPHRVKPLVNLGVVLSVDVADRQSLWVGTARGLLRVSTGEMPAVTQALQPRDLEVRIVHRDARGTVWLATSRGLGRLVDGRFALVR